MEQIAKLCERYRSQLKSKIDDGELLDHIEKLMTIELGEELTYFVMDTLCTIKYTDTYTINYIKAIFNLKESNLVKYATI